MTAKPFKTINHYYFTFPMWGGIALIVASLRVELWLLPGLHPAEGGKEQVPHVLLALSAVCSMLSFFGLLIMLFAFIYSMVSLYRCWAVLQGATARTTPGKAVGYLFIPVFNLYWCFVAIMGLAKDANTFCEQRNIQQRISVALSTCDGVISVLIVMLSFHFFGEHHLFASFTLMFVNLVIDNILIVQWAKFLNSVIPANDGPALA